MLHRRAALAVIITCSWSAPALAAEPVVTCRHKTFPNLPGENSMLLMRQGPAGYELVVQSYGKPRRFKVKCTFHRDDAGAFYCAQGSRRGFFSNRIRELSVSTDARPQTFEGYSFQAVDSPLGASRKFMELRFAAATCKRGK